MVRCESHGSASSVCLYHSYYRVCQVCIQKILKPERKTLIYSIKDDIKHARPTISWRFFMVQVNISLKLLVSMKFFSDTVKHWCFALCIA